MKFVCIALLLPLLSACATEPQKTDLSCGDAGSNTYYFPSDTFAPHTPPPRQGFAFRQYTIFSEDDERTREWYSSDLRYLEQRSLSCGTVQADETYRLVWLRSFDPLVAIQFTRTGATYAIDTTISNADPKTGNPLQRIHRTLSASAWQRVVSSLQKLDFWRLPSNRLAAGYFVPDPPNQDDNSRDIAVFPAGKDGAHWIIEGRVDHYHVVDRWSDADDFIAVGRIFIELSGLKISEEDIY